MKDTKESKHCINCINYDKKIDKEPCKICVENVREKPKWEKGKIKKVLKQESFL